MRRKQRERWLPASSLEQAHATPWCNSPILPRRSTHTQVPSKAKRPTSYTRMTTVSSETNPQRSPGVSGAPRCSPLLPDEFCVQVPPNKKARRRAMVAPNGHFLQALAARNKCAKHRGSGEVTQGLPSGRPKTGPFNRFKTRLLWVGVRGPTGYEGTHEPLPGTARPLATSTKPLRAGERNDPGPSTICRTGFFSVQTGAARLPAKRSSPHRPWHRRPPAATRKRRRSSSARRPSPLRAQRPPWPS